MFPFVWVGAAFAAGFLTVAMLVFLVLARLLRVPEDEQGSILPGLVSGVRDWATGRSGAVRRAVSSPGSSGSSGSSPIVEQAPGSSLIVEQAPGFAAPVERVAARGGQADR